MRRFSITQHHRALDAQSRGECAVGLGHLLVDIGEQGHVQRVLGGEPIVVAYSCTVEQDKFPIVAISAVDPS